MRLYFSVNDNRLPRIHFSRREVLEHRGTLAVFDMASETDKRLILKMLDRRHPRWSTAKPEDKFCPVCGFSMTEGPSLVFLPVGGTDRFSLQSAYAVHERCMICGYKTKEESK